MTIVDFLIISMVSILALGQVVCNRLWKPHSTAVWGHNYMGHIFQKCTHERSAYKWLYYPIFIHRNKITPNLTTLWNENRRQFIFNRTKRHTSDDVIGNDYLSLRQPRRHTSDDNIETHWFIRGKGISRLDWF